jgi:hypothetical protein
MRSHDSWGLANLWAAERLLYSKVAKDAKDAKFGTHPLGNLGAQIGNLGAQFGNLENILLPESARS